LKDIPFLKQKEKEAERGAREWIAARANSVTWKHYGEMLLVLRSLLAAINKAA
jgi:hypothetical protein